MTAPSSVFANVPHLRWGILGTGNIAGKFATEVAAVADRATLQAVGSRQPEKSAEFAKKHGIATAHIGYQEVLDDPQVKENGSLLTYEHPTEGTVTTPGFPIKFSVTPSELRYPTPVTGQHTRELLEEIGYGDRVGEFLADGVIAAEELAPSDAVAT